MNTEIKEYMKDESLDYLIILKALVEIPFNMGKNLLADFLMGSYKNPSITKNNLFELQNFGRLNWSKERTITQIEDLIRKQFIDTIPSEYNRFAKVLRISIRGQNEIINPTLNKKSVPKVDPITKITKEDFEEFNNYSSFLKGYNNLQKKAITMNDSKILCIAGAGTGKTSVLTKRIDHLVKNKGVDPKNILAITFTRKARNQMQNRLQSFGVEDVDINTFNSFCEGILREYGHEIYGRQTRVQTYSDKILAINMALANLGLDINLAIEKYFPPSQKKFKTESQLANSFMNDCFSVLEYFKASNQEEHDFSVFVDPKDKENAKMVFQIVKLLKENMHLQGLRDFTDQLIDTVNFLKNNPNLIPKYEYILIDEYQDVNSIQVDLIKLLNPANIFSVGDPRQAIFGWRGSDINFILNFEKDHGKFSTVHLTKNYRSTKDIVDFANKSIKHMDLPDLIHHKESASLLKIIGFDSEEQERIFIIDKIKFSTIPKDKMLILARTNRQISELSQLLKQNNIPHLLKTEDERTNPENRVGQVTLATIHAIKGLQAKKVIIMGCTEQNFPCKASDHPAIEMLKMQDYDKFEEEKRLFYVAISRAKDRLYLTYSGKNHTHFITSEMKDIVN